MFGQNTNLKIKTKNGWEHFTGIQKISDKKTYCVVLESGKTLDCTSNHKLMTPFGFVELSKLFEGDMVEVETGFEKINAILDNIRSEDVYDIIDAGTNKSYYTNGILSHNCEFIGSTNTLIHPTKIRTLVFQNPVTKENYLDIYELPQAGKTYVISVDVAEGQEKDYSTFSVIDVTQIPYKQVAKYRNNKIAPMLYPTVIYTAARKYNDAFVLVEINSIGMQVADILHNELAYENLIKIRNAKGKVGQQVTPGYTKQMQFGLKQSVQTKKIGCANLKSLIENDKLIINDADTIMELTTFSEHKQSFAAEEGNNDDLVMTLVNFGWLTAQRYFKENVQNDIRAVLQQEQFQLMDQDIVPFGIIDNGLKDDIEMDVDGDLWITERKKFWAFDEIEWDTLTNKHRL
jgi:intein/homing endonuclease